MELMVLKTPVRAPQANAFCERVIGILRITGLLHETSAQRKRDKVCAPYTLKQINATTQTARCGWRFPRHPRQHPRSHVRAADLMPTGKRKALLPLPAHLHFKAVRILDMETSFGRSYLQP